MGILWLTSHYTNVIEIQLTIVKLGKHSDPIKCGEDCAHGDGRCVCDGNDVHDSCRICHYFTKGWCILLKLLTPCSEISLTARFVRSF